MTKQKTGFVEGESHPLHKLTVMEVILIYQSKEKYAYLASLHGVSTSAIFKIKTGQTWVHLTQHCIRPNTGALRRKTRNKDSAK